MNEEYLIKLKESGELFKNWKRTNKEEDYKTYKESLKELDKFSKKVDNEKVLKILNKIK